MRDRKKEYGEEQGNKKAGKREEKIKLRRALPSRN